MEEDLIKLYDRFSFDKFFRLLLMEDYNHEEALNFVLNNCKLSSLVFQERIENKYYKNISIDDPISDDLKKLIQEMFNQIFPIRN